MKNDCALGMLKFVIILCFLSVVGSNLKAQIVIPPKLEFIGLEENWSNISKDTNVSIRPTTYISDRSVTLALPQKENEQKIFRRGEPKTLVCVRERRLLNIGV